MEMKLQRLGSWGGAVSGLISIDDVSGKTVEYETTPGFPTRAKIPAGSYAIVLASAWNSQRIVPQFPADDPSPDVIVFIDGTDPGVHSCVFIGFVPIDPPAPPAPPPPFVKAYPLLLAKLKAATDPITLTIIDAPPAPEEPQAE